MTVFGTMTIAGVTQAGEGAPFRAFDAASAESMDPEFRTASAAQIEAALAAASSSAGNFAQSAPADRALLLEAIGDAIMAVGDPLIDRAMAETGLPRGRLEGEHARTVNQLRLFATMLREGEFASVRIDRSDPSRMPAPKPDLRLSMIAIGPVAVFSASNFPLAFSVGGGDTASALAAGCPVVVKGHPAHPGTAELVASAVAKAIAGSRFDPAIFSLLQDSGVEVGKALVADPRIAAVGFTGSRQAGEALIKIAAARSEPIPVYAEMSAINPVILCPARLEEAAESIATSFVASLTLGTGQFCTKPGLLLAVDGPGCDRFVDAASRAVKNSAPGIMLTPGICNAFARSTVALAEQPGVMEVAQGARAKLRASAQLFLTTGDAFKSNSALQHEMFGPAALVVKCRDIDEMASVLATIEGQLTIAMHFNVDDHSYVTRLLPLAQRKAGRIIANGFGTGVEVSPAMVHGGPWPATSDSRTTSVGTMAVARFLRPVCLQDFPEKLLPPEVTEANTWGVPRRVWG